MAKREITVYTCDECEKEFPGEELSGMTARVSITADYETPKFTISGDYCKGCLGPQIEMVERLFKELIKPKG